MWQFWHRGCWNTERTTSKAASAPPDDGDCAIAGVASIAKGESAAIMTQDGFDLAWRRMRDMADSRGRRRKQCITKAWPHSVGRSPNAMSGTGLHPALHRATSGASCRLRTIGRAGGPLSPAGRVPNDYEGP